MSYKKYNRALTMAGSDSGGGAGIQADLKTFSALGCYGMSVITAITAQNTREVTAIHAIPAEVIGKQIDAVLSDIGVDAIKIGMLQSPEVILSVANHIKKWQSQNIVLDPVMIAKSGDKLLKDEAIDVLRKTMIPLATIITPNIPEAEVLTNREIQTAEDMVASAKSLLELGTSAVLLKGGHFVGADSSDCFLEAGQQPLWLKAERIDSRNTHGTGCTLSSAIAAGLAKGFLLPRAVEQAKNYIHEAIQHGAQYQLGHGHGPVHHFYQFWS